jgi:hypothetical protein
MVFLRQQNTVLEYMTLDLPQLVGGDALVSRELNRIQPEFALTVRGSYVNVRRLIALVRVKVKPILPDSQNRRHSTSLIVAPRLNLYDYGPKEGC